MHLFKKTLGFMTVLCVIPAAFAATSRSTTATPTGRVSISSSASRFPNLVVNTSSSTSSTSTSSLLADTECVNAYTECIKGPDACGANFEECTNKVLFHAQMPDCLSTLAQCSSDGINSLFGTKDTTVLSKVAKTDDYGEPSDYTYPTDGSVLGQLITAAKISNRYDTSTCIRRYTSCLTKDTVCGQDFELCTTNTDFLRQRIFCDSTLARCQGEAVKELLGDSSRTATPTEDSRIGVMIKDGRELAAINSVSTCYKTVDQCILNACAENPYMCVVGVSTSTAKKAAAAATGEGGSDNDDNVKQRTNADVAGFIENACLSTIGANRYCFAASDVGKGNMPTNAQLRDEAIQKDVFDDLYASRMNDNDAMKAKIKDLAEKFDAKAKGKCADTIKSCAMRACGGGSGAACYALVYGTGGVQSINAKGTDTKRGPYEEIESGCAAIVNTDNNCKYAAANADSATLYSYSYIDEDAFGKVFPVYDATTKSDPIGVVATLNALLATSYDKAAIEQLGKQCANVAKGCVISMCGNDYVNCYRNRTDITTDTYNTQNSAFDKSMNKVNGILDYTIVLGLCADTVKNSSACEEHLAIKSKEINVSATTNTWGSGNSVRNEWVNSAKGITLEANETEIIDGCTTNTNVSNLFGKNKCDDTAVKECGTVDANGCVYDQDHKVSVTDYKLNQSVNTLFKEVLADIERAAQIKYNEKLTREQNMCFSSNAGGIMGNSDFGSTFMWVKLKSNKIPKNYSVEGLTTNQFVASNDLYGSFCRVRVTLQSDDKKIQDAMKNKSWDTAYFATGDSFTCGSWIPEKDLEEIANTVAKKAVSSTAKTNNRLSNWMGVLGALGGTVGGVVAGEQLRTGKWLPGLTGWTDTDTKDQLTKKGYAKKCVEYIEDADSCNKNTDFCLEQKKEYISKAEKAAKNAGVDSYTADVGTFTCAENGNPQSKVKCFINKDNGNPWTYYPSSARNKIATLKSECSNIANAEGSLIKEVDDKHEWVTAASTAVGAIGGFAIGKIATKELLDAQLSEAERAAYDEWMNNVGRHITCYIGGEEAGSYGDIISTSLE